MKRDMTKMNIRWIVAMVLFGKNKNNKIDE